MRKILKRYGNTAVIGINKEEMKSYNLKVGDKVDIEIGKNRIGKNTIVKDVIFGEIKPYNFLDKVIDHMDIAKIYHQATKQGKLNFCFDFKENISPEYLVTHLRSILKELEFRVEVCKRVRKANPTPEEKLNKSILRGAQINKAYRKAHPIGKFIIK